MAANEKIEDRIGNFLQELGADHELMRFAYNANLDSFDPEKSSIFYSGPYWDDREIVALMKSVLTGKWLASGENVHKFEIGFSKRFKFGQSVMVNSGSSANLALIGALKHALKWNDNDEVILSVVGFPTTLAPICQHGLKPVFADIEMDTLNFDLDQVEAAITSRTRAIFISPVLGNPPDMDRLVAIAEKHKIHLVMDNCDSLGSTWKGKYLTEYSVAASCSFYPAHHITTGEGGMVSSDNEDIVKTARSLSWWGRDCWCVGAANLLSKGTCGNRFDCWLDNYDGILDHKYVFAHMGYNLKPLDMQGAIGLIQLEKFDDIHARRRNSKEKIQEIIERNVDGVRIANELPDSETSWFGVPIICESREQKTDLVAFLEKNRIQTRNYFAGNILLHPGYRHLGDFNDYPLANRVLDEVFFVGAAPHYGPPVFDYMDAVLARRGAGEN